MTDYKQAKNKIFIWLLQLKTPVLGGHFEFYKTANEIADSVRDVVLTNPVFIYESFWGKVVVF